MKRLKTIHRQNWNDSSFLQKFYQKTLKIRLQLFLKVLRCIFPYTPDWNKRLSVWTSNSQKYCRWCGTISKLAPGVFHPIPTSKKSLQFLKNFHFQCSDRIYSEYIQLWKTIFAKKHCPATNRNGVGKFSSPFRIVLKPDFKLQAKKPNDVLFHFSPQPITLLDDL